MSDKPNAVLIHGSLPASFFNELKKVPLNEIYVLEGRPSLKSVKASVKELQKRGLVPTVLADNMAGYLFYKNLIKEVWVACQPKDKKGVACQPGAIILSALAKRHNVPVYGYRIKGKSRADRSDLGRFNGQKVVNSRLKVYSPASDELPASAFKGIYG